MKKLSTDFLLRDDVVSIARDLIGKIVLTKIAGKITAGRIVETEAYVARTDRASHSYNGRRTARNEAMYQAAGTVYVYICYGLHRMLNVVTNKHGIPDAVLIRAVEPLLGLAIMEERSGKKNTFTITKGPGNVCKALGIEKPHSGSLYNEGEIGLYEDDFCYTASEIAISKRIGVEGAGVDADRPYRFYVKGNKYVSGRPN